ncbi:MAG TPA: type II toxin-antitoxin system RelE/ParE family toxin [Candidatus Aphodoplasma excrementigallinarum]|uniref:Type II toxin-antitoxin system RelE/ParE family toxin n=1 Tax=Candidatus Aphodoplasma excrementigallinarum TaxID=2840673 RepID=A0A9D1NIR0_9FIRM|nr:type II toxin-antitoxin system RelE/ParE family toxin [Candidatus Aphodoplasma excrementigallinarum]
MYKVEFLPIAAKDMHEIVRYISKDLCNPMAAARLAKQFITAADTLGDYPYASAVYTPIRPLEKEYRKLVVKNYMMFYWADEAQKCVTVASVLYAKRDYGRIIG